MAEILGVVTGALQLVETALKARDYVKDFRNAPAEQQKLFSEMTTLKSLLEEFQKRVGASDVTGTLQHMVVPLARFTTVMEKFTVKFGVADGRWSQLSKRLTWTLWNKTEAKEYIVEFESIKSLLNAWLAVGIWDAGQEHKKDHAAILSAVDNNAREQQDHNNAGKKKQIMDWITSLNFFQRQADIFSLWQPGTGQWLLSNPKFYKWESVPGQILWCRGIPGAGKTILSSLVIHHLRDQFRDGNIGVACIYLDHKETEAQTPVNLLAGLWKQLVVDKPLTIAVQELYRHHQQRDTSPVIDEVFSILQAAVAERSGVYFVIDALDEYPEHQRNILLRYLSRLQAPTISFLITSRPHVTLAPFFTEPQTLEILATEADIGRYVDNQIETSSRLFHHVQTQPALRDEIRAKIVGKVKGVFLLAKLHSQSLATKNTIKAVRDALRHLPTDLKDTYDDAMFRIKSQNDDDRQLALRALTWVAYAKRPLFVEELQEALAIEPSTTSLDADNLLDLGIVLSVCAGLVIVDETMSVVRLIHYTTQHYFDGIRAREFGMAHSMIAGDCLAYLSFDEFTDITFDEDVDQDLVQKFLETHPLVAYSQYFLLHAADAPNQLDLQTKIEDFLEHAASWRSFWRRMFNHELAAPWSFIDGPPTHSLLWISAASNLLQLASHMLTKPESVHPDISFLSVAVFYGHIEMAELLLKSGTNVNAPAGYYGTVLQASVFWGNQALVQLLLDNGADVNLEGGQMGTALQAASYRGREDSVQLLIEHGANVNTAVGHHGTALHAASCGGHEVVVRLLLERGADVNAQGGIYGTALRAASRWGHNRVVQLLMDHGADVNSRVKFDGRVMQMALRHGYEPAGRHLVERRVEVDDNAEGRSYGTALQAASRWGDEGLVRLLLEHDANVNEEGGEYGTALQAAAHGGNTSVARLLIEHGADVNALGGHYGTALQAAAGWGHHKIVRLLIEHGSNINIVGGHYGTALQAASAWGHQSIVELLVERGADVNAAAVNSAITMQWTETSAWGRDTTRLFLASGVDVNKWDGYYGTALQAASAGGHEGVVEYLLEHGAIISGSGHHGTALQAAAHEKQERVVHLLVQRGADVNQSGRHGTALHAASQAGHEEIARWLIEQGTDVNMLNENSQTPLDLASYAGHLAIVRLLIQNGADPNAGQSWNGTPLAAASGQGHTEIVEYLLERGVLVNTQNENSRTPLDLASYAGHLAIVRLLIQYGADPNTGQSWTGTPLAAACGQGHTEIVEYLLGRGTLVNTLEESGTTALEAAVNHGDETIVQLLLEHGADLNLYRLYPGTMLQIASRRGHEAVVRLLIERGVDVNEGTEDTGNALLVACFEGHPAVVRLLIQHGADVNAQEGSNGTALQAASLHGYEQIVEDLLASGADVNAQGGRHVTALYAASVNAHKAVVRLLLARGVDVNAAGLHGTALQAASHSGSQSIVQLLLEHGADVNAEGGEFGTALQAASKKGSKNVVQLLLERGADVNAQAGPYGTALHAAQDGVSERPFYYSAEGNEVVQLLLDHGADVSVERMPQPPAFIAHTSMVYGGWFNENDSDNSELTSEESDDE